MSPTDGSTRGQLESLLPFLIVEATSVHHLAPGKWMHLLRYSVPSSYPSEERSLNRYVLPDRIVRAHGV